MTRKYSQPSNKAVFISAENRVSNIYYNPLSALRLKNTLADEKALYIFNQSLIQISNNIGNIFNTD